MPRIEAIEGIGHSFAKRLSQLGIKTTESLLEIGASAVGRQQIKEKCGISWPLILRWVNQADLLRVKGIGSEYAELLEAAGVDSVPELSQREPASLRQKLAEANQSRQLVRRIPSLEQVKSWIRSAKELPRVVTH